jgi:butyrate kinase
MSEKQNEELFKILAINPGSTSTKVSVYLNKKVLFERTIEHHSDLQQFESILSQEKFRCDCIFQTLESNNIPPSTLDAVVGRGGLIKPIESGTYRINKLMLQDLKSPTAAMHASSLGAIIAHNIGSQHNIPSFVVDPVVVDEMNSLARFSGLPDIPRISIFHALNQKAVARLCAREMSMDYENARFIVVHMGGGISVGAHNYGRVIDVTNALNGEGAFTPERSGIIALVPIIECCYSEKYSEQEMKRFVTKSGGMKAYLGTNDVRECERKILAGDMKAEQVLEAMAYQVSKDIGSMATVLEGKVDAIILTGGMAHSNKLTGWIKQRVGYIAPVRTYPGEEEMEALTLSTLRVLRKQEKSKEYV